MDLEQLAALVVAAFVTMKIVEALVVPAWEKLGWDRFYLLYVVFVPVAVLAWFTGLNVFPVFATAPAVGRVLSCLAAGFGPSFLWDITDVPRQAN